MDDNTRRSFLKNLGIASVMATKRIRRVFASNLATSALAQDYVSPRGNIRVPESDDQWKAVKDYVDEPGPEYHTIPAAGDVCNRDESLRRTSSDEKSRDQSSARACDPHHTLLLLRLS